MKNKLITVFLVAATVIAIHVVGQRLAAQAAIRDLDSAVDALAISEITGVTKTIISGFMTDDLIYTVHSAKEVRTLSLSVTTLMFIPISYIKVMPN